MSQADKSSQGPHMNNNPMNMGGMPGMAVPIGQPNMNNGQPAGMNEKAQLNTYIYDYFLKHHMYDCAQAILREGEVFIDKPPQPSPARRAQKHDADGNIMTNGMEDSMDGADGSATRKTEEGEDAKPEFPLPIIPRDCPGGCFLYDWWCLFWDIFGVRTAGKGSMHAAAYLSSTQHAQRLRQQQEQLMLQRMNPQQAGLLQGQVPSQVMNPGPGYQNPMLRQGYPNGVMIGQDGGIGPDGKQHLVRQALMNNNKRAPPAQQLNALKNQQMMQQTGQRDQDVDMSGQQPRPQSPAGSQAAASPGTKRRNLGGGDYQEVGPGGRGQTPAGGTAGTAQASQAHQILVAHGIDPNRLTPQQFAAFQLQNPASQQRSIQLYAQSLAQHAHQQRTVLQQQGMPKGIPHVQGNPAAHGGSPMMPHTSEGAPMNMIPELYGAGANMRNAGQAPGTGSHALQDYQMQLMLLEQQNKKRLLMARQEQDNIQGRAEQGNNFQGMSPQGGRAAPSPQPPGDMKRGTPKMNPQPGPGSPLPDGQMSGPQQRASPATSMPGFNGQPIDAQGMFYPNKMNEMLANGATMPNGAMMRPPGHAFNGQMTPQQMQQQVDAMNNPNLRQQQAGRGQPAGNVWQPHPGMANAQQLMQAQAQQAAQAQAQAQAQANAQQQAQQQNTGTPGQSRQNVNHSNMPPPSAPATQANGRTPSSPSVNNQQPPTPTQANKAAPKRKEAKERKRPQKKVNAAPVQAPSAVTPSSEPPTPTTPQHGNSFNSVIQKANFNTSAPGQAGNGAQGAQQAAQTQPSAAAPQAMPQPDSMNANTFSGIPENTSLFDDFNGEAGNDTLLDNFDFDSFLNNPDEGGSTGLFDPSGFAFTDAVEAGAGES